MNQKISRLDLSRLALLTVAVLWGSSLVVVKSATDSLPPNFLLAIRFTVACVLLCIIFRSRLKLLNKEYWKSGAIIGICLFFAYSIQTLGVTFAMPGKSAFLSSIYCVIVPFLFWLVSGQKPDCYHITAAFLCIAGMVLSSVTDSFSVAPGDLLAILSGLFFAAHIVAVAKYGKDKDPILITILQFGFSAAFSLVAAAFLETPPSSLSPAALGGALYLAVFCTAAALLLQNIGQRYCDPSSASILLSLESVFGVLFSVVFFQEQLTPRLVIGFALIFGAVVISETKLSFLRRSRAAVGKSLISQ